MFISTAPDEVADKLGKPFMGQRGQLFADLLKISGLDRKDVFVTNLLACHTPNNRVPSKPELTACRERLLREINAVGPDVIVALGPVACKALLTEKVKLAEDHGIVHSEFFSIRGAQRPVLVLPILHLDRLLRQGGSFADGESHRTAQHFDRLGKVLEQLNIVREGVYPWQ